MVCHKKLSRHFFHTKLFDWVSKVRDSSTDSKWREVLSHYREMERAGVEAPDPSAVFPLVLRASSNASFSYGTSLHGLVVKKGLDSLTSVGNSTIDFYAKSGHLDAASAVFRWLTSRDSVSWNIMVYAHLRRGGNGDGLWWFHKARLDDGFEPNDSTLVLVIQACRGLGADREGQKLHGFVIRSGLFAVRSVQNSLIAMYAAETESARKVFDEIPERDVVSWSTMIKNYASGGEPRAGLRMFLRLVREAGVELDGVTVVSVLRACAGLGGVAAAAMGKSVHGLAIRRGLDRDPFVGNSLIDMYSKCGDPRSALEAFEDVPGRNNVTWNSVVSGLVLNGKYLEALSLFESMGKAGIEADEVSIVNVLQICKRFAEPLELKSVHCVVFKRRYESNEVVLSSLIDGYAKFGLVDYAQKTFYAIGRKSKVLWSTMIAGFARLGRPDDAISVFQEMVRAQEKPNEVTIINLLEACSVLAELKRAKWAHGIAVRRRLGVGEVAVGTAILDMYSKCGEIEASRRVFLQIPEKNIVTWSAMISAYGTNGLAREALALHAEMMLHGMEPNAGTALGVLSACSHGGLVEEGLSFFNSMARDHGVEPRPEHYSCVVDMLGRAGKLDIAMEFIKKMPQGFESGAKAWGSLLSSCKSYGDVELGTEAAARVLGLEPLGPTGYLMASAVYASGGLWAEAAHMRKLVKEKGVKVVAGNSIVHVGDTSCKFVAGDFSHSNIEDIKSMVEFLHSCMKEEVRFT